jgi:hypothetical protein
LLLPDSAYWKYKSLGAVGAIWPCQQIEDSGTSQPTDRRWTAKH